jgi:hypothetical protein
MQELCVLNFIFSLGNTFKCDGNAAKLNFNHCNSCKVGVTKEFFTEPMSQVFYLKYAPSLQKLYFINFSRIFP